MAERLIILDTTLRVGLTLDDYFDVEDRIDIADELVKTNVDVIEAGQPAKSRHEYDAVRRVVERVRTCRISALVRCVPRDVEVGAEALAGAAEGRLHLYVAIADVAHPSEKDRMDTIAAAETSIRLAKRFVSDVEFSLEQATGADFVFLAELVRAALAAGATTINLPDRGFILPDELAVRIARLESDVPELEKAVLSFHGHDDLGVSTANAIAAVRAGARQVEVAVGGVGDIGGNTSLEELLRVVRVRADVLGVVTRLDTTRMAELSALVKERALRLGWRS